LNQTNPHIRYVIGMYSEHNYQKELADFILVLLLSHSQNAQLLHT